MSENKPNYKIDFVVYEAQMDRNERKEKGNRWAQVS